MIVQIDDNYHLETDGFNGVTLVFTEKRIKETKEGELKGYDFKENWYYPNPKLAIIKYFELTNKEIHISELESKIDSMKKKLDEIYNNFAKVNWKLK